SASWVAAAAISAWTRVSARPFSRKRRSRASRGTPRPSGRDGCLSDRACASSRSRPYSSARIGSSQAGVAGGASGGAEVVSGASRHRDCIPSSLMRKPARPQERAAMTNLRQLEDTILANGRVESPELEVLRRELYAGGKIGRREADFLVELHKRVQRKTPAFE